MVNKNCKEQNNIALLNWVVKALDATMSKRNIKNGFKVTRIWLNFNPKAMDGRTKPNELYIAKDNIITWDEKNVEYFEDGLNDIQD